MNDKNVEKDSSFMRITVNLIVIVCASTGLIYSIIGLMRFTNQKLLFFITSSGCFIALLIGIIDLFKNKKDIYNAMVRIVLSILSGFVLILASFFLIFFTNCSLFIKSIAVFGIIFFSTAIIKGLIKLLTTLKKYRSN